MLDDLRPERLEMQIAPTPEVAQAVRGIGALAVAQAYEIDSADMAQALANERRDWAKRLDKIEGMKKDLIQPLKKAMDDMRERLARWFDPAIADLTAARDTAGVKLLAWETAERARIEAENAARMAEARKIRQEAEAKAAAEQARAEELAREARRKAAEAAEAQRKAIAEGNARAAAAAAAEAAKQAEKAQAAIENGQAKALEAQLQAAAAAPVPVAAPVKIAGQSIKETWQAELLPAYTADQAKLEICMAIAAGRRDLLALVEVDSAPRGALNKLAAALKGAMNVPGYQAKAVQTLAGARK